MFSVFGLHDFQFLLFYVIIIIIHWKSYCYYSTLLLFCIRKWGVDFFLL